MCGDMCGDVGLVMLSVEVPYLHDELVELRDKIIISPGIRGAGVVCDFDVNRRNDVAREADETGVDIQLLPFKERID